MRNRSGKPDRVARRSLAFLLNTSCLLLLVLATTFQGSAQVTPTVVSPAFSEWKLFGDEELFVKQANALRVQWDSSRTNSYCYYPLGLTLRRQDHFRLTFVWRLDSIAIGATPGKDYTFEIATGLMNISNAFDPGFFRSAGINPEHGPRNLLELDYFPDSGFGATVAPSYATEANQIAFSDNHPLELTPGVWYRFEMTFTPEDQTLRSRMWQSEDGANFGESQLLRDLVIPDSRADFRLSALAVPSYSDAGQTPPFAGSIKASGSVSEVALTIYDRPKLEISVAPAGFTLTFETNAGWRYQIESSDDTVTWIDQAQEIPGTGSPASVTVPAEAAGSKIFRVRAERP